MCAHLRATQDIGLNSTKHAQPPKSQHRCQCTTYHDEGLCSSYLYSYLGIWTALNLGKFAMTVAYTIYYTLGSLQASRAIHQQLIHSILRSTFRSVFGVLARASANWSADGWVCCFVQHALPLSPPNRHHAYISTACSSYAGHANQCVS
jgi:hypothetical protein